MVLHSRNACWLQENSLWFCEECHLKTCLALEFSVAPATVLQLQNFNWELYVNELFVLFFGVFTVATESCAAALCELCIRGFVLVHLCCCSFVSLHTCIHVCGTLLAVMLLGVSKSACTKTLLRNASYESITIQRFWFSWRMPFRLCFCLVLTSPQSYSLFMGVWYSNLGGSSVLGWLKFKQNLPECFPFRWLMK